ncbi:hypothetical protein IWQ61_005823 [Dispira simplex]|nr:hypothetical protein IWQ61_005823 [Dispira simplex]
MGGVCCRESNIDFNEEVRLAHFDLLRCVGKGAFGKVRIVQHRAIKQNYALKYINKDKCIRMKAIDNIIQERRILEEIKFPLICNLRYAFQDDENMFMVLDLMLGGDLRFHIDRKGALPEEVTRFLAAEMIVSTHYLHSKRFVHRDIKPDNVLLDSEGHAHLTDFNIAVRIRRGKKLTSVAGSLAYMAPEVLQRMGYTFSVDWWSMGVVLYELVFGFRPFRAKSNDELARLILQKPLTLPEKSVLGNPVSKECREVILGLCERNIHKRLGFGDVNYQRLISHPWFEGIDWERLSQKQLTPLFVPDSKHSNFDATHELEELLMEDTPLRINNRSKNPKLLSNEMLKIETEFTVYDHTRTAIISPDDRPTDIDPVALRDSSCSTKVNTPPGESTTNASSVDPLHATSGTPYTCSTPSRSQEGLVTGAALPSSTPPRPPAPAYDPLRRSVFGSDGERFHSPSRRGSPVPSLNSRRSSRIPVNDSPGIFQSPDITPSSRNQTLVTDSEKVKPEQTPNRGAIPLERLSSHVSATNATVTGKRSLPIKEKGNSRSGSLEDAPASEQGRYLI